MSIPELVSAVVDDNKIEAESMFKHAIQKKIGDALETKRREVANNFVKTPQAEKDEEVWRVLYSSIGERWAQKI